MAKNMDSLAKKLGATVVGTVPDYSAGAFGMAALAETLRERLEPSVGKPVLRMLEEAAGQRSVQREVHNDLDYLAGTWSEEEAAAFEVALAEQRKINVSRH